MTSVPPVSVLIADDSGLFAAALRAVLSGEEGIEVVGTAANGADALELARRLRPRIVLMDISMPGIDGFEATEQLTSELEGVRVLMLTGSAAEADIRRAHTSGASAYVTKDRIDEVLVDTIRNVAAGLLA
jgi:DNA-binding NarL/FixJ family response regulator